MTDGLLWGSGFLIVVIFAAVIWINRRRMKAEAARMRGDNPEMRALAEELKRGNDLLEQTVRDHEARIRALEMDRKTDAAGS